MSNTESPYVSATDDFSNEEKEHIAEALSEALGIRFRTSTTSLEAIDIIPILTISLEVVSAGFIGGLSAKMGSDTWDLAKSRIIKSIAKRRENPKTRLELRFQYDGTEVTCSVRGDNLKIVEKAIDGWKDAVREVTNMVEGKNLPGQRVILYYSFDGSNWEITDATVMEPGFDKVRFDRKTKKWEAVDPNASRVLREFEKKLRDHKR